MKKKCFLTLQNGKVFEGISFGAERETVGELVFTTGVTGYLETLTDPSYFGQIITQTFPLIGNYGVIPSDFESSKVMASGYVVRERCSDPSNFRSVGRIEDYLKEQGVPAVYGVDTRELTKTVREAGVMNAAITFEPFKDFETLSAFRIQNAVRSVTSDEIKVFGENNGVHVVLFDFGAKRNIERELVARGCKVTVVPAYTPAERALALRPDGIMLANGPGDPAENTEIIGTVRELVGKKPMLGICLGHQLLALAMGGRTRKMKYGHRGGNQPVKELSSGKVFITSQNHGYEVVADSIPEGTLSYVNVNDGTCEGMEYPAYNASTVQFHPEACGGPHDASFLFEKFIARMKQAREGKDA